MTAVRRISWLMALSIAGSLLVSTSGVQASPERSTEGASGCFTAPGGDTEICFNDPRTGHPDPAVTQGLLKTIARAGAGDSIRIAMFRWDHEPATAAVLAAQKRGARIEIVADEDMLTKAAGRRVLHEVETGEPGFRNVVVCKGACLPWTGPAPAPTAQDINHHKLFLFDIGGVRSVAVTSSNFETRMHGQGNSMIRATAPALWRFHHAYFNRLKAQRWDGWVEPNLSVRSGKTQAWVYPRRRDPVVATLRSVRCDARFRTVDVLWAVIQRADVRRALQEVHRRGCRVRVVTTRDLIENWLEVPQRGADGAVLDLPDSRVRTYLIHDKVILIHARIGKSVKQVTITGTSNATCGGHSYNDEVMWRIEDQWVQRTMRRHFEAIYKRAYNTKQTLVPTQAPCR